MLQHGCGTAKDEARAAELYRLSAEQGNWVRQNDSWRARENGLGVAKDEPPTAKDSKLNPSQLV
jgi:TPR repeat protein